jgi:hypothetical protein
VTHLGSLAGGRPPGGLPLQLCPAGTSGTAASCGMQGTVGCVPVLWQVPAGWCAQPGGWQHGPLFAVGHSSWPGLSCAKQQLLVRMHHDREQFALQALANAATAAAPAATAGVGASCRTGMLVCKVPGRSSHPGGLQSVSALSQRLPASSESCCYCNLAGGQEGQQQQQQHVWAWVTKGISCIQQ